MAYRMESMSFFVQFDVEFDLYDIDLDANLHGSPSSPSLCTHELKNDVYNFLIDASGQCQQVAVYTTHERHK